MRLEVKITPQRGDTWSGPIDWKAIAVLNCRRWPRSGKRTVDGIQETEQIKYDIFTPWNANLRREEERRLVDSDGRVLWVESVLEVDDEQREHHMICTERPSG